MRLLVTIVIASAVAGCGRPQPPAAAPSRGTTAATPRDVIASDAIDAAVSTAIERAEAPVGAVPIPGEAPVAPTPIHLIDHDVEFDDLPAAAGRWLKTKRLRYAGRVLIALHVVSHDELGLSIVDTNLEPEATYPGALETFMLGPTASQDSPPDGNAYPPRNSASYTDGAYDGPIRFAIRPRMRDDAPDDERRQVVVCVVGTSVLLVERRLGATTWTRRLKIDLPRATEIVAIDPGWH